MYRCGSDDEEDIEQNYQNNRGYDEHVSSDQNEKEIISNEITESGIISEKKGELQKDRSNSGASGRGKKKKGDVKKKQTGSSTSKSADLGKPKKKHSAGKKK